MHSRVVRQLMWRTRDAIRPAAAAELITRARRDESDPGGSAAVVAARETVEIKSSAEKHSLPRYRPSPTSHFVVDGCGVYAALCRRGRRPLCREAGRREARAPRKRRRRRRKQKLRSRPINNSCSSADVFFFFVLIEKLKPNPTGHACPALYCTVNITAEN